jgi:hypothetical protein
LRKNDFASRGKNVPFSRESVVSFDWRADAPVFVTRSILGTHHLINLLVMLMPPGIPDSRAHHSQVSRVGRGSPVNKESHRAAENERR